MKTHDIKISEALLIILFPITTVMALFQYIRFYVVLGVILATVVMYVVEQILLKRGIELTLLTIVEKEDDDDDDDTPIIKLKT